MAKVPAALLPVAPWQSGDQAIDRISSTTSQDSNELTPGTFATVINSSATEIAIRFTDGLSGNTAVSTDLEIGKNGRFDWYVQEDSKVMSVIAADGSSTFECWVWASSPLPQGKE